MSPRIGVRGVEELKRKLGALSDQAVEAKLGEVVMAGAEIVEARAKIAMGGEKHGHTYGTHVASAPGEAPAIDMGALVNDLHSELAVSTRHNAIAAVGTGMEYARPLEFGTGHLAARPFLRPAVEENVDEIRTAMTVTCRRLIEEAL